MSILFYLFIHYFIYYILIYIYFDNCFVYLYNDREVIRMPKEMTPEDVAVILKKALIDAHTTAAKFWESRGVGPQNGNNRMRKGSFRFYEFVNMLHDLGYAVEIKKIEE